jgi:hypothetical protein
MWESGHGAFKRISTTEFPFILQLFPRQWCIQQHAHVTIFRNHSKDPPSMTEYSNQTPREFDLTGRAVIVAGAGRGIGKGIARVLAESGLNVLATALTETYMSQVAAELADAGHPIEFMTADATCGEDMAEVVEQALSRFGRLEIGRASCRERVFVHV